MLKITFHIRGFEDGEDMPEKISRPRLMRIWVAATANLAKSKAAELAQKENSRSFIQREVLQSVQSDVAAGLVYSDSYIAVHVHEGGIVRPSSAKFLAIPIDKSAKGKFARDFPNLVPFVSKTTKDRDGCFLGLKMKTKIKPLFILKRSVEQKPRPWWPTQAEAEAETLRVLDEDF